MITSRSFIEFEEKQTYDLYAFPGIINVGCSFFKDVEDKDYGFFFKQRL